MSNIQTIIAPTLGDLENLFDQIFPDVTDDDIEIVQNVKIIDNNYCVKIRRL